MFCRVDVGPLLLGGLLEFTTCLGGIHYEVSYLDPHTSVLVLAGAARLAGATATATDTRGIVRRCGNARIIGARRREIGARAKVRVGRHITTTLVRFLRQLEDLSELQSLVRLHRLLNVSEPLVCHFV